MEGMTGMEKNPRQKNLIVVKRRDPLFDRLHLHALHELHGKFHAPL